MEATGEISGAEHFISQQDCQGFGTLTFTGKQQGYDSMYCNRPSLGYDSYLKILKLNQYILILSLKIKEILQRENMDLFSIKFDRTVYHLVTQTKILNKDMR